VQAVTFGDEFNVISRAFTSSLSGFTAQGSDMSGGTRRTITVVTQEDFDKARGMLIGMSDAAAREELFSRFRDEFLPITTSVTMDVREPVSSPGVGEELSGGRAKLTAETIYAAFGVDLKNIEAFVTEFLNDEMERRTDQRIYDTGIERAQLTSCHLQERSGTCNLVTSAEIGPDITEGAVRAAARGKRFGEVQSELEAIHNVREVYVEFSFFWVRVVPDDDERIQVRFETGE